MNRIPSWAIGLVKAFLSIGDYNIFAVDWSSLSSVPWYLTASKNTLPVGRHLALFLEHLCRQYNIRTDSFHLIGFSLGAHVVGIAGQNLGSGKLLRITGLDPAQVLFTESPMENRLDSSDAELVEVIHTSGGFLGFLPPMGHRDFFPNGGYFPQPGCSLDFVGVCSHRRAYYYYGEAVSKGQGFPATLCSTWDQYKTGMCRDESVELELWNENTDNSMQGNFFLETNPKDPYGHYE